MSDAITVRRASSGDSEGIARAHIRSWQSAYRGLIPDELLDGLRWQDRKARWEAAFSGPVRPILYVAADSQNEILGFASVAPCRDEDLAGKDAYELYAIYLAPEIWRTGIGTKLLAAAVKEIPEDTRSLSLWVLKDNPRGRRFYESQGFKHDGVTKMLNLLGQELEEVRYRKQLSSNL